MENPYKINPAILIACVFQIIFMVVAGTIIYNSLTPKVEVAKIGIDNYSSVDLNLNLTDTQKSVIEGQLASIVALNNADNTLSYGAEIRAGSTHDVFIDNYNIHFLSSLIDIKELGQSYRVIYRWADQYPNPNVPINYSTMIFCPHKNELIYADFDCHDNFNGRGAEIVLYQLLYNQPFMDFTVATDGNATTGVEKIYIMPMASDDAAKSAAEQTLRSWLANLGFNLDDFPYTFRYNDILEW